MFLISKTPGNFIIFIYRMIFSSTKWNKQHNMAAAKLEKDIISEEVQSIELYQTAHVATHAYVAPFVLIHAIFFPVWIYYGFFENFEIGCIILAVLGVIQVLVCLACHWSIHIRASFTCSRVNKFKFLSFFKFNSRINVGLHAVW